MPERTGWPWVFMVNSRTRKLPSSVHLQVVWTTASWLSLIQSPTSHSSSLRRSWGVRSWAMLVADGGLEPVAVVLDVDDGEAGDLGRARPRPGVMVVRPSSSAVSGPRKRSASVSMAMVLPGIVGERRGELVADGGAALGPLALLVDDEGVLRVRRGGGRGVARVEGLRERRDQRGDGLGVVGPLVAGAATLAAVAAVAVAGGSSRPSRIPGLPSPGKSRVPPH